MKKYQNKYRSASARLQTWDYASNGAYFITICTENRYHFFGDIMVAPNLGVPTMRLNELGEIAQKYWMTIPDHFPGIQLGDFVVMPNHTHGILIIEKNEVANMVNSVMNVGTPKLGVPTANKKSSMGGKNDKWKPGTIGVIINQYKRIVTINARKIDPDFGWQFRFHDHIIRDDQSFQRIQQYIIDNPMNWGKDKFRD